jgi:hypothetical protein
VAIFTSPQGHGLLLYAIATYLERRPLKREELARTFCPGHREESAAFSETLDVGRELGVLKVGKTVETKRPTSENRVDTLRTWTFEDSGVASELFSGRVTGATDLVRGLCWLLAQDPTDGTVGTKNFETRQHGLRKKAVVNAEQFRPLARWACWLGLATQVSRTNYQVLPDLRQVVRDSLPNTPSRIPIAELEASISTQIPVIAGGYFKQIFDAETGGHTPEELSPALSLALESLRAEGSIRLSVAEDAAIGGQKQRLLARTRQPVTDVEVLV